MTSLYELIEGHQCINAEECWNKINAAYTEVAASISGSQFVVSEEEIKKCRDLMTRVIEMSQRRAFDMLEVSQVRRENLLKYGNKVKFISLGEDCFVRTVLTRWGMKPFSALGERGHPFDLAVHPIRNTASLLANGFAEYLDPGNLVFMEQHLLCYNRKLGITFNHEYGPQYAENDFAELREIYSRRIEQLRMDTRASDRLVYVLRIMEPTTLDAEHIKTLAATLDHSWNLDKGVLVVLKTHRYAQRHESPIVSETGARCVTVDIDDPYEGYVWHLPQHCFSPDGHRFEKLVIECLSYIIRNYIQI